VYRTVSQWDTTVVGLPGRVKLAGATSLVMWFMVIYAGRWLAYG